MKTLLLTVALLLQLLAQAQTRFDTLLFNAVNEQRISRKLPALAWDTCIYNEARSTFETVSADTGDPAHRDSLDDLKAFVGLCGDYLQLTVLYDGELDRCCIEALMDSVLSDISQEEGEIVYKANSKTGACYFAQHPITVPNPAKKSRIKFFHQLHLVFIIGTSY